jgi:hypothetical protein
MIKQLTCVIDLWTLATYTQVQRPATYQHQNRLRPKRRIGTIRQRIGLSDF